MVPGQKPLLRASATASFEAVCREKEAPRHALLVHPKFPSGHERAATWRQQRQSLNASKFAYCTMRIGRRIGRVQGAAECGLGIPVSLGQGQSRLMMPARAL